MHSNTPTNRVSDIEYFYHKYPHKGGDVEAFGRVYKQLLDKGWTHEMLMAKLDMQIIRWDRDEVGLANIPRPETYLTQLAESLAGRMPNLDHIRVENADMAREIRKDGFKAELEQIGIPPLFLKARFRDFKQEFAESLPREPQNILISGSKTGLGKTHLAASFIAHWKWADQSLKASWENAASMVIDARSSFGGKSTRTERDIIAMYRRPQVLILDDFGSHKVTEWSTELMYVLINHRLEDMKPTVITTNLSARDIHKIDKRIGSRVGGYLQVGLDGKDRRLSGN